MFIGQYTFVTEMGNQPLGKAFNRLISDRWGRLTQFLYFHIGAQCCRAVEIGGYWRGAGNLRTQTLIMLSLKGLFVETFKFS